MKVSNGNKIKCALSPARVLFLFLTSAVKSPVFNSSAIPNMIRLRIILSICKLWGLKFTVTSVTGKETVRICAENNRICCMKVYQKVPPVGGDLEGAGAALQQTNICLGPS